MSEPTDTNDGRPEGLRVRELTPERVRSTHRGPAAPTRYVADRLVVRLTAEPDADELLAAVRRAAAERGLGLSELPSDLGEERPTRRSLVLGLERLSDGGGPQDADAWDLLDDVFTAVPDSAEVVRVGLDHLMDPHRHDSPGSTGEKVPVSFAGPPPRRSAGAGPAPWLAADGSRRPVVAVVDSGVGYHSWFQDSGVAIWREDLPEHRRFSCVVEPRPTNTRPGSAADERYAGHGTFVAGVVHQTYPDAAILPVLGFEESGAVNETRLVDVLDHLLDLHRTGAGTSDGLALDVVVLAVGYYHERPADDDYEGDLHKVLRELREAGVLVVVSAGNDGSPRVMYPAAWAPQVAEAGDGHVDPVDPDVVKEHYTPIFTVGANNPNGTLARFSNLGPWVTCRRLGARVISTVDQTVDGPNRPWKWDADGVRATVDPDDFSGGFAMWSGTSFAAPVLAGELARGLEGRPADADSARRVVAAWDAIYSVDDLYRRPAR